MSSMINQDDILQRVKNEFNWECCHGVFEDDLNVIKNLIESVVPNDTANKTVFPDFVCNKGFIEHFHVTSGKSNRKGYDITKEESKMAQSHEQFMENVTNSLPEQNQEVLFSQHHTSFWRSGDSIINFHNSLKKAWDNHIKSLKAYDGEKGISCFLVSSDDVIAVKENTVDEQGVFYGDLLSTRKMPYSLAYDNEMLDYLYNYKDIIDFVVYFNLHGHLEVVQLKNIPNLKQMFSKREFILYPLVMMEASSTYGIHVPINHDDY